MSATPKVFVCAGGGGVGKTTTSAALALAFARAGKTTLVVTVDPARRLADAMGIPIGSVPAPATIEPAVEGRLFALMPEPRESTVHFVDWLFEKEPAARERMKANPVYMVLANALAGIHELVCTMLLVRATEERAYDVVVVDTAPSRYALDFLSYPGRLAGLLEGKAVAWLSGLADRARGAEHEETGGALAWGRKRVESALGRVVGTRFLIDITALFGELAHVRERFAWMARRSEQLVLGDTSRYLLVSGPSGAARADVTFLAERLQKMERRATAVVLNRADLGAPAWLARLGAAGELPAAVREATAVLEHERLARTRSAEDAAREFGRTLPRVPQIRLPRIDRLRPDDVVRALAVELEPHLAALMR